MSLLIVLVIFAVAVAAETNLTNICKDLCATEKYPLCVKNGVRYLTYPSPCEFEKGKRCLNLKLKLVHYGICANDEICELVCDSTKMDEVCTKNSKGEFKTYFNECTYKNARCSDFSIQKLKDGPCTDGCGKQGSAVHSKQVCVRDKNGHKHTFESKCAFEKFRKGVADEQNEWLLTDGPCTSGAIRFGMSSLFLSLALLFSFGH